MLDPSIQKTKWTREEEEKLLHLGSIMANLLHPIEPMVGRNAAQCIQNSEKFVDSANRKGKGAK